MDLVGLLGVVKEVAGKGRIISGMEKKTGASASEEKEMKNMDGVKEAIKAMVVKGGAIDSSVGNGV